MAIPFVYNDYIIIKNKGKTMATIVRDSSPVERVVETREGSSGAGFAIGIIALILLLILFFVYGLPALRNNGSSTNNTPSANINVTPSGGSGSATTGQ